MSIIIRLQNLPWAADSVDIRRYFSGLSIPEGGVHIVGGEMGDAFIAFSTDEDARLAMAKDGGKIHEMQIKLLLSSRTEMLRVIEKARQLNLALQAQALPIQPPIVPVQPPPARIVAPPVESDRRRARSPSPSHRRSSRDKSPGRSDRRRSPDSRRSSSKRERSRSPARSSRSGNRDTDRRDRFKRDDRRYDESRYRDDRHAGRESSQDPKKYSDVDHLGRQPRGAPPTEAFREPNSHGYSEAAATNSVTSYTYDAPSTAESMKGLPAAFFPQPLNQVHPSDPFAVSKQIVPAGSSSASSVYMQQPMAYGAVPYGQPVTVSKESPTPVLPDQANRVTRFQSSFPQPQEDPFFTTPNLGAKPTVPETTYNDKRPTPQDFHSPTIDAWATQNEGLGNNWTQKRSGLLDPPISKNGDFIQVVPMDIEKSPPDMSPDKNTFDHSTQYLAPRNDALREMPLRGNDLRHDKQWHGPSSLSVVITGLPPDARIEEVQNMFQNIVISPLNICIQANAQGAEKAFIRFTKPTDFQEAVNGQPRYIRNYHCNIIPCPEAEFEAAVAAPKAIKPRPKPKPREEDLCVQLRGIPFNSKEQEIQRFFEGLKITDIAMELSSEGRSVGIAFAQFATLKDFKMALTMNGKMIGHRFITISVASKEHIALARGLDYSQMQQPKGPVTSEDNNFDSRRSKDIVVGPSSQGPAVGPLPPTNARPTNFCLSIKGMPNNVTNQDIVEFFSDLGITIRAIHLMLGVDKRPTGDAFVEFSTKREATAALSKNNKPLLGNRVFLSPISFQEMTDILDGPKAIPPPPILGPLLSTPTNASPEKPRRPLINAPPAEENFKERAPHNHPPNERLHFDNMENDQPHFDRPQRDRPHFDHPRGEQFVQGERPHSDFNHGERPHPDFSREERPHPDFSHGDRHPDFSHDERQHPDFPRGERQHPDFSRGERQNPNFPRSERPHDFPRGDRPHDFPRGERPHDFPRGERPHDFPRGERPHDFPRGERPPPDFQGERPPPDYQGERLQPDFHGEGLRPNFPRGDRPRSNFPRGERPRLDYPRGERPRFDPRFRGGRPPHMERGMRPPFGRMRGPFPRPGGPPPVQDQSSPAGFGAPGCVVSINNLHFDAGLEELSEFFKGFMLTKDNIIRRFDESGRATAEARVAFQNPRDAQKAVRELNKKTIMGRSLFLSLL